MHRRAMRFGMRPVHGTSSASDRTADARASRSMGSESILQRSATQTRSRIFRVAMAAGASSRAAIHVKPKAASATTAATYGSASSP